MPRDFIPEGQEPTRAERAYMARLKAERDLVPYPDVFPEGGGGRPGMGHEAAAEQALQVSLERAAREAGQLFAVAHSRMLGMDVGPAVELLQRMPSDIQGVYLLAEEAGLARQDVLGQFAPVSEDIRGRYFPAPSQEKAHASKPKAHRNSDRRPRDVAERGLGGADRVDARTG